MPYAHTPILSAWLVLPVVALAMLLVAGHVLAIQRIPMPASRRRIRTANGLIMLCLAPILAYALCIAVTENHRQFVLVWMTVIGLLAIVVMLAIMDVLNNLRLSAHYRKLVNQAAADELARNLIHHAAANAQAARQTVLGHPDHRTAGQ